jgi:hypothetical protein
MTDKKRSIPVKDVDFHVAQEIIADTASLNRDKWMLDEKWLDSVLLPAKQTWDNAWESYINPAARTPAVTFAKNEQRKTYEKLLRILVRTLQGNIHVTPEELNAMGIIVPSSGRTPAPVAAEAPDIDVDTSVIGRLTIHFFRQDGHHRKGKPDGQRGAEIRWVASTTPVTHVGKTSSTPTTTPTPPSPSPSKTTGAGKPFTSPCGGKTHAAKRVPGAPSSALSSPNQMKREPAYTMHLQAGANNPSPAARTRCPQRLAPTATANAALHTSALPNEAQHSAAITPTQRYLSTAQRNGRSKQQIKQGGFQPPNAPPRRPPAATNPPMLSAATGGHTRYTGNLLSTQQA